MTSALFYLQYHSARNRLWSRFRRMRQPKYFFGAIVGAAWFYFYFFRVIAARRQQTPDTSPEHLALLESIGALVLFVIVLLAWVVPHSRAALVFTEAEVAFLFPAPLSRRGLIHFKLLRSQVRIFFTTFFLTLIFNRLGGSAWMRAAGWWLALSTLNLHFLGSSFARTLLLDRGISHRQRRIGVLALVGIAATAVIVWAGRTLPPLDLNADDSVDAVSDYAGKLLVSGPMPYLLYPFRLVVRPYFSAAPADFLLALGPAVLLLALHYVWVIRSNVSFEEASVEASQKMAARIAAARANNWQGGVPRKAKKSRAPFRLQPFGPPAVALLWKNLISAGQMFTFRLWLVLITVAVVFLSTAAGTARGAGILSFVGMLSAMFLGWSLFVGPQFLRQDLRQDIVNADILKSFPLRGWQIVLGEMLTPTAILTGVQWLLLIFASDVVRRMPHMTPRLSLIFVLSIGLLLPGLNAVMLLIPNAGVLLFPAWFQTGKDAPQGIEATGQRLIMMIGQLLAFLLALVPAAILFLIAFFVARYFIGPLAAIAPAAGVAAIALMVEAALGVLLLGRFFERFDLSAELS